MSTPAGGELVLRPASAPYESVGSTMRPTSIRLQRAAFTIVELLIVIVVIGVLAAISVIAYNGLQNRAKSAAIVSDIKQFKKGMLLLAAEQGRSTWWLDNSELVTGVSHPTVEQIIQDTNLKQYMRSRSGVAGTGTSWYYDSDPEPNASNPYAYLGCDPSDYDGINLFMSGISSAVAQAVDDTLDDGNVSCGSVTLNGSLLRYNLSRHKNQL